ncbi:hypothetical protein [Ensifer sp.]|uniref:hypothetical protein n=1 Tax=Ensifer sp. TaxID=1872086 RepID=UPI000DD8B442|nr:hypothetical protein [Ensifer sp.]
MSKVVVIGIEGEKDLWVVDLGALTVERLDLPKSGGLKAVADRRAKGENVIKGADVAVVVKSADAAMSGHYEG